MRAWLEARPDLKISTRRSYALIVKTHLEPMVGHIDLDRLRPADVTPR